jgi:hypothetical protein
MTTAIKCESCQEEYTEGDQHECKADGDSQRSDSAILAALAEFKAEQAAQREADEKRLTAIVDKLAGGEPHTPSKEEKKAPESRIQILDRFDQMGYAKVLPGIQDTPENRQRAMAANLEIAMMVFGGTRQVVSTPSLDAPEDLTRAWQHHVLEAEGAAVIGDGEGNPTKRAMDSQETGYGLELIGAQYVRDLWEAARNMEGLVGRIREIPMADPTVYVPIDGDLPEMLFVGESTSASATAYTTSKTASNRVSMTAKKFTIQQVWSGELNEDSIIAFVPFLRERLNMSASLHLGSAYYNGDETNAGTGNINLDDANPADTKHYLAWDGIRHYWLVDATGQGKSMAAVIDPLEITRARGKLNAGDDDVDNLIKNINWGKNAAELLLVMDWDTYMNMLELDKVQTVDKYGEKATLVTGELGRYMNIPIISPSYATKTEADGKCSDTEASNTLGQVTLFNPSGFLAGNRRGTQLFFDRIQRTDQFLFELYTRRGFTRFGGNVAAGIYNITVA